MNTAVTIVHNIKTPIATLSQKMGSSFPFPISEIAPYMNGAGKYPQRLLMAVAIEFAVDLRASGTVFSMIPVSDGIINAPTNKSNHTET